MKFLKKRNGYQPKGENPPVKSPKPPMTGSGIKNGIEKIRKYKMYLL